MGIRKKRLETLRNLIASNKAGTQEDILGMLAAEGYVVTQATLSRDLKDLQVSKSPDISGNYRYRLPGYALHSLEEPSASYSSVESSHVTSGIISVEFSGQAGVMKTKPGYANMVASIIDSALAHKIMGTIAGDDTILMILRAQTDFETLMADIEAVIPGVSARRI